MILVIANGNLGQSSITHSSDTAAQLEDLLPPFATLTNDEDRERKAEFTRPGTYHVVVNPESFSDMPEYQHKEASPTASLASRGSIQEIQRASTGSSGGPSVLQGPNDPNVVVLRRFEDPSRRSQAQASQLQDEVGQSRPMIAPVSAPTTTRLPRDSLMSNALPSSVQFMSSQDEHLLSHFRVFVWPCLAQAIPHGHEPGLAKFEEEALIFPPVSILPSNYVRNFETLRWNKGSIMSLLLVNMSRIGLPKFRHRHSEL